MTRPFAFLALALLAGCDRIPGTTASLEREAREALRTSLLDAESARFEGLAVRTTKGGARALCGQVNAKNRMGAYAGFSRFVIDPAGVPIVDPQSKANPNLVGQARRSCRDAEESTYPAGADAICRAADDLAAELDQQMTFNAAWFTGCESAAAE